MEITLGQQYNVGEKPTVILYTYINRHAVVILVLTFSVLVANSKFTASDYSYFSLNYVPRQTMAETVRKNTVSSGYLQTSRNSQYAWRLKAGIECWL